MLDFLALVVIVVAFLMVKNYNRLKLLAEAVTEGLANIFSTMQKVTDLANKLQEIASTYSKDEQFTMVSISKESGTDAIVDGYRDSLESLKMVNLAAQRFPDLKASGVYKDLMSGMVALQNELGTRREAYNSCVRNYNSPLKTFPTFLYAPMLGLQEAPYWQSDDPESLGKLKEFKTDDERIRQIVARMGSNVKQGASTVGAGVLDMTRQGAQTVKAKVSENPAVKPQPLAEEAEAREEAT